MIEDYNRLTYEFAIRNPKVIELLKSPLTDEVADKLLTTYGINIKVEKYDRHNGDYLGTENSLEELCLDYPHLADIKGYESSGYKGNYDISICKKLKKIFQPEPSGFPDSLMQQETDDVALKRINMMFEKKAGRLNKLMDGSFFCYYDKLILTKKKEKPSKREKKNVETIQTYIKPSFYLKLLPEYRFPN